MMNARLVVALVALYLHSGVQGILVGNGTRGERRSYVESEKVAAASSSTHDSDYVMKLERRIRFTDCC